MSRSLRPLLVTQFVTLVAGAAILSQTTGPITAEPLTVTPVVATAPMAHSAHVTSAPHATSRPAARPAAQRATQVRPVVRHHRRHRTVRPAVRRTTVVSAVVRTAPVASTAQQRMDQAVARIPGYPKGGATWVLTAKDGYWGTADWYHNTVYISPSVPANRIYDVVAHEWSHMLTVQVYAGDVDKATAATNAWFGGSGLVGAEKAADCMARRLGATWTHYTPCTDSHWQAGAARLLARQQL